LFIWRGWITVQLQKQIHIHEQCQFLDSKQNREIVKSTHRNLEMKLNQCKVARLLRGIAVESSKHYEQKDCDRVERLEPRAEVD
jgi:hypothetical protein